ncbi:MAG: hypothetical protein AAGJ18_26730 [Bacteroidota bacterium]
MRKSNSIFVITVILLLASVGCKPSKKEITTNESTINSMLYFGQTPPSTVPIKFAPDIISKADRYEFGCTLSEDGKEFYFGVDNKGKMEIHRTMLVDGKWTPTENLFPNDSCGYNDPMFSVDEQRLYFISNRPAELGQPLKDIDIWYVQRYGEKWSTPINVGAPVNNHLDQYFASFNANGDLYFASKDLTEGSPRYAFDIYKATAQNGQFMTPEKLSAAINTERYEADVFIAPDESYLIFCDIRKEGLGQGDLYISFKDEKNQWTEAVSMGAKINTDKHELCPFVTKDGKYFFYTSNQDIYWVSTTIFDAYK